MSAPGPHRITREFTDNAVLRTLYGPHNAHLHRIERGLGVSVTARGNRVAISGETPAVAAADAVLLHLYDRIRRHGDLEAADIDAALRRAAQSSDETDDIAVHTKKRVIHPRSPNQAAYLQALRAKELVFALGPAGTGKTYLAVAEAVSMLLKGVVDRIVLSRPAVEAGERLGFLPGDLREKVDPYLRPLYDALHDMLPTEQVAKKMESGEIEVAPLAFMRGRTLANAFVILDEAQNATPMQMKMFLTRLGEHARMVVAGDPSQIDLPGQDIRDKARSGLTEAVEILEGEISVGVVRFTEKDVVRHDLVTRIVKAYDRLDHRRRRQDKSQEKLP